MKIRVVFQGGGARLATLIAGADALRSLVDDRGIDVDRTVGVSAGSIAAAMFGCRRDFDAQREALRRAGNGLPHGNWPGV